MIKQNGITLVSAYKSTDYTLRVNEDSDKVLFWIYEGSVHAESIAISKHDIRPLINFLNSLERSHETVPKPTEPAYLAVFHSTPSGWSFHRVNSKEEATIYAAKVKKEHPNRTVRLVNMLADYGLAEPVYEWKDL